MVTATLRILVPASKRTEILHALRALGGPTEAHPGCLGSHVYRADDDENTFLLLQEWTTQAALDRYIQSDLYGIILAIMETASEPPHIQFDTLAHRAGVEIVEAARNSHSGPQ